MLTIKAVRAGAKDLKQIIALTEEAFPQHERLPFWFLLLMSYRQGIDFTAYYDDGELVGISYVISDSRHAFVLYLATDRRHRSKGYGSRVLDVIEQECAGKDISLDIEMVNERADNYEQRLRRLAFYQRKGFRETGFGLLDGRESYSILTKAPTFIPNDLSRVAGRLTFGLIRPRLDYLG